MLTSYELWKSICLRNDLPLPWESSNFWGCNILIIKIKIKCPAGQNLEIMTFRYLETLVFDKVFKKLQHHLMLLFLKSI